MIAVDLVVAVVSSNCNQHFHTRPLWRSEIFRTIYSISLNKIAIRMYGMPSIDHWTECEWCTSSGKSTSHDTTFYSYAHSIVLVLCDTKTVNERFYICFACSNPHISIEFTYFRVEWNTLIFTYRLNDGDLFTNFEVIVYNSFCGEPTAVYTSTLADEYLWTVIIHVSELSLVEPRTIRLQ